MINAQMMPSMLPMGGKVPYLPIPAMTSNTTPAGWEAFADSEVSAAYAAWKALDGDVSSGFWWSANTALPHHVGLSAPSQFKVVRYAIVSASVSTQAPTDFSLQGSNDGAAWDVIDTRSGVTWVGSFQRQEWGVASPGAYSQYRLLVTGLGSGQQVRFCELELLQEDDL